MLQTALKVTGIDHVVLYVRDLERARAFYEGFLGMELEHEGPGQAFLRCGTQQVALFTQREGMELRPGSEMNHMALRLAAGERAEVKAALEAAGCEVHGRPRDPDCLYFTDPDGHRLQVLTPAEQH
ncbi:MAG TPA: VOC family protein [Chloroflexota bacterium]|jgi:catechol 2,3-dioxygenase-like lactoylglutathione lyase family enzyme